MLGNDLSALTEPEFLSAEASGMVWSAPAYRGHSLRKRDARCHFTPTDTGAYSFIFTQVNEALGKYRGAISVLLGTNR